MSLVETFRDWCVTNATTIGSDQAFVSRAPSSNRTNDAIWWFRAAGGSQTGRTIDGRSLSQKVIEIYYRNADALTVADKLDLLASEITCHGCLELDGYVVISVEATGPFTDQDLDSEERTVGLLQITIEVYEDC